MTPRGNTARRRPVDHRRVPARPLAGLPEVFLPAAAAARVSRSQALEVIGHTDTPCSRPIGRDAQIRVQRVDEQLGTLVREVFRE